MQEIKNYLNARAGKFDQICQAIDNGRVGIWGYGFLGRWFVEWMNSSAKIPPLIFDARFDDEKMGSRHLIRDPQTIEMCCEGLLITARHNVKTISGLMNETDIPHMSADEFFLHRLFSEYESLLERLEDDKSRATLVAIFKSIIFSEVVCDELVYGMYFQPSQFFPSFDDHFIDAGAYTGDTLEEFVRINLGTFKRITCFEPGLLQFEKLKKRKSRILENWILENDQIILEQRAVGEFSEDATLNVLPSDTMAHHIVHGDDSSSVEKIEVIALDDYLNGQPASFLKSDVEGNDFGFIKGAKTTIVNYRPKLAISCYHYPTDLINIFNFIDNLGCSYKFKLRHHAKVLGDYVLYGYA